MEEPQDREERALAAVRKREHRIREGEEIAAALGGHAPPPHPPLPRPRAAPESPRPHRALRLLAPQEELEDAEEAAKNWRSQPDSPPLQEQPVQLT